MISIDLIKQLREETGLSVSECKKALEKARGDIEKAKNILKKMGEKFAAKKKERETGQGIVASYIHPNKKIGVLLDLRCETDFVAESQDFQNLAHELCLQIAAIDLEETPLGDEPKGSSLPVAKARVGDEDKSSSSPTERSEGEEESEVLFASAVARVLEQPWIKDETKRIKDLIGEYIAKIGENIVVKRFTRYQI